jgi:DNA-binding ferritin-like protein
MGISQEANLKLDVLFAYLIQTRHNIQMIHWVIKGKHFNDVHKTMDDYKSQLDTMIDDVGEINMAYANSPLCLDCIYDIIHEFGLDDIDIDCKLNNFTVNSKESWMLVSKMFNKLLELYTDVIKTNELFGFTVSKFDEHMHFLFSELSYKIRQRLDD